MNVGVYFNAVMNETFGLTTLHVMTPSRSSRRCCRRLRTPWCALSLYCSDFKCEMCSCSRTLRYLLCCYPCSFSLPFPFPCPCSFAFTFASSCLASHCWNVSSSSDSVLDFHFFWTLTLTTPMQTLTRSLIRPYVVLLARFFSHHFLHHCCRFCCCCLNLLRILNLWEEPVKVCMLLLVRFLRLHLPHFCQRFQWDMLTTVFLCCSLSTPSMFFVHSTFFGSGLSCSCRKWYPPLSKKKRQGLDPSWVCVLLTHTHLERIRWNRMCCNHKLLSTLSTEGKA